MAASPHAHPAVAPALLLQAISDAVIVVDIDWRIQEWNPAATDIYGWERDTVVGQAISAVLPVTRYLSDDTHVSAQATLLATDSWRGMVVQHHRDGAERFLDASIQAVRNGQGVVQGYIAVNRDVTTRLRLGNEIHETRLALAAHEQRLAFLVEASQILASSLDVETTLAHVVQLAVSLLADCCVLHLLDAQGAFVQTIARHTDPARTSLLEQLGQYDRLALPAQHPLQVVARTRAPLLHTNIALDDLLEHAPDAAYLELLRQLNPRASLFVPLLVRDHLVGVLVLTRTTEGASFPQADQVLAVELASRAAQAIDNAWLYAASQTSEALLDTLYATAPVGLSFVDTDLRYVRINETLAAINGLPVAAHAGRAVREVVPSLAPLLESICQQVLATGKPLLKYEINGETAAAPGVPCSWLASYYPVLRPDGALFGVGAVVIDITERKAAEEALRELLGELERRVDTRTAELAAANAHLHEQTLRLTLVNTIAQHITTGLAEEEIIARTVRQVAQAFPTLRTAYVTIDTADCLLVVQACQPEGMPDVTGFQRILPEVPQFLATLRRGEVVASADALGDPRLAAEAENLAQGGIHALLHVPLLYDTALVGMLCFDAPAPHQWSEHEVATLTEVADQLAVAIQNARTTQAREQALAALEASEQRYRTVVGALSEGIVLRKADGRITACNASAERIPGLSAEQMMGRRSIDPRWRAVRADGSPFPADEYPAMLALRTGQPQNSVMMGVHKPDDTLTWISINAHPLFREDENQPYAVVCSFADITAQHEAETALRLAEQTLRGFFESAGVMMGIVELLDDDILHIADNAATAAFFGTTATAMQQQRASALGASPAIITRWHAAYRTSERTGRSIQFEDVHETAGRLSWLSTTVSCIGPGPDGRTRFAYVSLDVTERVRAEQTLRASEARLEAVVAQAPIAILIERGEQIIDINQAACDLFGFADRATALGQSARACIAPENRALVATRAARRAQGFDEPMSYELRGQHQDGTTFPMLVHVTRITLTDGPVTVIFYSDLRLRQEAEEARIALERQAQELRKLESLARMAGGVAHDYNNVLMVMLGNLELLTEEALPARAGDYIARIRTAGERAAALTRQMLAFSGSGQWHFEPLDLASWLDAQGAHVREDVPSHIALTCSAVSALPLVSADPMQLEELLVQLVMNAAEAIADASGTLTLHIDVRAADHTLFQQAYLAPDLPAGIYVALSVQDTGVGMSEEIQAQLFEPFFSTKFIGRGLGLSAVLGIVRGHRGAILVKSIEGEGTTVTVLLPALLSEPLAKPPLPGAIPAPVPSAGAILVVDDEESVRVLVARMLRRLGYVVLTASDGNVALEMVAEHGKTIAAALLDLTMPDISGDALVPLLRALKPDLPILVMSGYAAIDVRERFANLAVTGILAKPFVLSELRQLVNAAIPRTPTSS